MKKVNLIFFIIAITQSSFATPFIPNQGVLKVTEVCSGYSFKDGEEVKIQVNKNQLIIQTNSETFINNNVSLGSDMQDNKWLSEPKDFASHLIFRNEPILMSLNGIEQLIYNVVEVNTFSGNIAEDGLLVPKGKAMGNLFITSVGDHFIHLYSFLSPDNAMAYCLLEK